MPTHFGSESGYDDVGTKFPDYPHHIGEDFFVPPFGKTFFRRLGVTEIDGPGEKLFRPVDGAGSQQFLRPDDT